MSFHRFSGRGNIQVESSVNLRSIRLRFWIQLYGLQTSISSAIGVSRYPEVKMARHTPRIYGNDRNVPTNGTCLKNVMITGKKSLLRVGLSIMSTQLKSHQILPTRKKVDSPKQVQESKCLDNHTHERPFEEDKKNSSEETDSSTYFLFASKEVKRLLRANNEC